MKHKLLNLLRWLCVLPACIGVVVFIALSSDSTVRAILNESHYMVFVRALSLALSIIASVLLANLIAPTNKFHASCAIALIWVLWIIICSFIVLMGELSILDGGVGIASTVIGLVIGLYLSWKITNRTELLKRRKSFYA